MTHAYHIALNLMTYKRAALSHLVNLSQYFGCLQFAFVKQKAAHIVCCYEASSNALALLFFDPP